MKLKIKYRQNRIIRKVDNDNDSSSTCGSDWHSKKYISSSVLKALALEADESVLLYPRS